MIDNVIVGFCVVVSIMLFLLEVAVYHSKMAENDVVFNIIAVGLLVFFLVAAQLQLPEKILHAIQVMLILLPIGFNLFFMNMIKKDSRTDAKIAFVINILEMIALGIPFVKVVLLL